MKGFHDIKGYEGKYYINKNGEIFSENSGRILSPVKVKSGYLTIVLTGKKFYIHRLIAQHFIPNPSNLPQVNHKNGIKTDNRLENLEWVTPSENFHHAYRNGLYKGSMYGKKGSLHHKSKKVSQMSKCGKVIGVFESISIAAEKTGIDAGSISQASKGVRKSAGGFLWILA